jgi:hypothetical protein
MPSGIPTDEVPLEKVPIAPKPPEAAALETSKHPPAINTSVIKELALAEGKVSIDCALRKGHRAIKHIKRIYALKRLLCVSVALCSGIGIRFLDINKRNKQNIVVSAYSVKNEFYNWSSEFIV